jgi:hypothetical protein
VAKMKNSNDAEERKAYFKKLEEDNSKMSYKPFSSHIVIDQPPEILEEIQPEIMKEYSRPNEILNENPGMENEKEEIKV